MDVNQLLLQRKIESKKKVMDHVHRAKRKFHTTKKYIDQELDDKLKTDKLADKKQQFYDNLFKEGTNMQAEVDEFDVKDKRNNRKQEVVPVVQGISKRQKRKEKLKVKQIYTQRTSRGQPIMKNYLDHLVSQIEKTKNN